MQGNAFGPRTASEPQPGQPLVLGTSGRRYANSAFDGDASIGRATSPPFELTGKLALKIGGTSDPSKLRVELWSDQKLVATVAPRGGDTLRTLTLDPGDALIAAKAQATLVLVDDSTTGHLVVDDVWIAK